MQFFFSNCERKKNQQQQKKNHTHKNKKKWCNHKGLICDHRFFTFAILLAIKAVAKRFQFKKKMKTNYRYNVHVKKYMRTDLRKSITGISLYTDDENDQIFIMCSK